MFGFLLRFARMMVQNILSQLTSQLNVVESQALNPMNMIVQQVTGGVWRGKGADAFVDEVSNLMIPGVGQVSEQVRGFQGNLQRATEIMDQADQQANRIVQSVADVFDGIF